MEPLEFEGRFTATCGVSMITRHSPWHKKKSGSRSDKAESTRKDFQAQRSNKTRKQNAKYDNIAIVEN